MLVPPDLGTYTVPYPHKCKGYGKMTDDVRRRDVPPPTWAFRLQGMGSVTHTEAMDNACGLASVDPRLRECLQTEQGPICLGIGPIRQVSWLPTVADLEQAPYIDTRRTAISDRYFR